MKRICVVPFAFLIQTDFFQQQKKSSSARQNMEQLPVQIKDKPQHLKAKTTQGSKNNLNNSCHILR